MAIYGVLLVFNEQYRASSIKAFNQFMGNLGEVNKIIIVNNKHDAANIGEVSGDNTNWEFSGWDKGLSTLNIKDDDVVVFANDTFLCNRSWGRFDQLRFNRSIKKLIGGDDWGICGEVHKFTGVFQLFGQRSDRWVCTYLFALSGGVINELKNICLSETSLSMAIITVENRKILWGDEVSQNLQERLQRWLYPPRGVLGWKKENCSTDTVLIRKAKTILNEKWLSAYCLSNGFIIIDAGPNIAVKQYRNMKYRMSEVIKRIRLFFLRIADRRNTKKFD